MCIHTLLIKALGSFPKNDMLKDSWQTKLTLVNQLKLGCFCTPSSVARACIELGKDKRQHICFIG